MKSSVSTFGKLNKANGGVLSLTSNDISLVSEIPFISSHKKITTAEDCECHCHKNQVNKKLGVVDEM